MNPQIIRGVNFTAALPPGFNVVPANPMVQYYAMMMQMQGIPQPLSSFTLLPPGSQPGPFTPAMVMVEELHPSLAQMVLAALQNLEAPDVSFGLAQSLQAQAVFNFAPVRQMQLQAGTALGREFDALGPPPFNVPIHVMILLIQGPFSIVKVLIAVQLYRWGEFLPASLQFVGGINLSGGPPLPSSVVMLADPDRPDQAEMNIVDPQTGKKTPIMTMPTGSQYNVTININHNDHSISVGGNVGGTGIAIGEHSLASTVGQSGGNA